MEPAADIVRKHDRLRFTATLYAPEEKRPALLALYAFNVEIARIRDLVNEPMAGEMRLQWWRDALSSGDGETATGHLLADELRQVITRHNLPLTAFDNLLEARRIDLYSDPLPSRNDLEGYCGDTGGGLVQLSNLILDPQAAGTAGDAAGHAGCALAIAGILSLLPVNRLRGQYFLPDDILRSAGASAEDLRAAEPGAAASRVLAAMIALGRDHVFRFEELAGPLPSSLRPAFLPAATAHSWLNALERAGDKVFQRPVSLSPLRQSAIALRRAMFGWR